MITFTIRQATLSVTGAVRGSPLPDVAETTWNGSSYSTQTAHGAITATARKLVAAGCPDQPWQAVDDDGERRLFGASLHRVAKLTVSSGDRLVPFKEFPIEMARAA